MEEPLLQNPDLHVYSLESLMPESGCCGRARLRTYQFFLEFVFLQARRASLLSPSPCRGMSHPRSGCLGSRRQDEAQCSWGPERAEAEADLVPAAASEDVPELRAEVTALRE